MSWTAEAGACWRCKRSAHTRALNGPACSGKEGEAAGEVAVLRRTNAQQCEQLDRQEQIILALQAQGPSTDHKDSSQKVKALEADLIKTHEQAQG